MRIAVIVVRTLMGLLFLFASIAYFLNTFIVEVFPKPELTGNMKVFNDGLEASIYLLSLVKVIELICGIAFVVGRFVPLATVLIAPIIVNIFCVHAFLARDGLPAAIFLVFANCFVAYYHRRSYAPLFVAK